MEARKSNEICIKMVNETNARTPNIQIDSRVHFITWLVDFWSWIQHSILFFGCFYGFAFAAMVVGLLKIQRWPHFS